jgi:hypothetical protein
MVRCQFDIKGGDGRRRPRGGRRRRCEDGRGQGCEENREDDGGYEVEPSPSKSGSGAKRKGKGQGKVGRPKKVKVGSSPLVPSAPPTMAVPFMDIVLGGGRDREDKKNTVPPHSDEEQGSSIATFTKTHFKTQTFEGFRQRTLLPPFPAHTTIQPSSYTINKQTTRRMHSTAGVLPSDCPRSFRVLPREDEPDREEGTSTSSTFGRWSSGNLNSVSVMLASTNLRFSSTKRVYIVIDFTEHDLKSLLTVMPYTFLQPEIKIFSIQLPSAVVYCHNTGSCTGISRRPTF